MRKLLDQALYFAGLDRGCILAIHMSTFLLSYFVLNYANLSPYQSSIAILTLFVINILNMAAIIVRITGLARGIKYNILLCYQRALSRLSNIIFFNITVVLLCALILMPFANIFAQLGITPLILLPIAIFIPFAIMAYCFVVDHEFNTFKALRMTIAITKEKISLQSISSLSLAYAIYLVMLALNLKLNNNLYLPVVAQIWILICHIMTITVYAITTNVKEDINPNIKVMAA